MVFIITQLEDCCWRWLTNPNSPGSKSNIDFVTIASKGNSVKFGDLTMEKICVLEVEIQEEFIPGGTDNPYKYHKFLST